MSRAFIGIGSNIKPQANIRRAVGLLSRYFQVAALSTFYRTSAIGRPDQPPFVNGVAALETDLPPLDFKGVLRRIEAELGRRRGPDKFAPRTIDLDLLLYENMVTHTPDLVLPDPQITQRAFLAIPLFELAPSLRLPGSGEPVADAARRLADQSMTPLVEYSRQLGQEFQADHR